MRSFMLYKFIGTLCYISLYDFPFKSAKACKTACFLAMFINFAFFAAFKCSFWAPVQFWKNVLHSDKKIFFIYIIEKIKGLGIKVRANQTNLTNLLSLPVL